MGPWRAAVFGDGDVIGAEEDGRDAVNVHELCGERGRMGRCEGRPRREVFEVRRRYRLGQHALIRVELESLRGTLASWCGAHGIPKHTSGLGVGSVCMNMVRRGTVDAAVEGAWTPLCSVGLCCRDDAVMGDALWCTRLVAILGARGRIDDAARDRLRTAIRGTVSVAIIDE